MLSARPFRLLLLVLVLAGTHRAALAAGDRPLRQVIDAEVQAAWQRERLTPAPRASDAEFLRRVYLDLAGTIPTYEEARRFLEDRAADRRDKLIERLLADDRFAAHQADVWDLVLFGRNPANPDVSGKRESFKKWLTDNFARNEPYDRWVRELLRAEQEGSEAFYLQYRNQPADAAEGVSRIFLGTQLQCARCHDHPYESWTQRDFYGMAGFFVRLTVVPRGTVKGRARYAIAEKSSGEVYFSGSVKEQKPGKKGEPVRARFLNGPDLKEPPLPKGYKEPVAKPGKPLPRPLFSRKEKLAAWVTARDNPFFARAVVNRVWAQFLGRGFVQPVDDLSTKNVPGHPALFETMTTQLRAHAFDLKWLIREVVSSETYQRAGTGTSKDALPRWYERARVRPLSAEELMAAMWTATGGSSGGQKMPGDVPVYFLLYFKQPTNGLGEFQGGLSEHLFLNNSDQVRRLITPRKGNLADTLLRSKEPWEKRVDHLFLAVLSRLPRPEEKARMVAHLKSGPRPEPRVEEAIWALLNTSEFRFNH